MKLSIGKMVPRSPTEPHRVSTPLELFFDLVFAVAVGFAASALHQDVSNGHIQHGILSFMPVFFGIWIAWLNFTWFASAYDIGGGLYRIMVLIQMTGALVLAAGVPSAFAEHDFRISIAGYVIMRMALVSQWLRAAFSDPEHQRTTLRYAIGTTIAQIGWVVFGFGPEAFSWGLLFILVLLELSIPAWAEHAGSTSWHPGHIVDRYAAFTIIVLGEAVLASSLAIQAIVDSRSFDRERTALTAGAILSLYLMWWIYFDYDAPNILTRARNAFIWGYGHVVIWAAISATGAGIGAGIDYATNRSALTRTQTQLTFAVPVALFLLSLWAFHDFTEPLTSSRRFAMPVAVLLIIGLAWLPYAPLTISLVLAILSIARWQGRSTPETAIH